MDSGLAVFGIAAPSAGTFEVEDFDVTHYQSTHNTRGTVTGDDPEESVVTSYPGNRDAHNLSTPGASAFTHNSGYDPTGTVGAPAFRAADGIE